MGNHLSDRSSSSAGKVFLSDGTVQEYDHPLTAAELMMEHPQEVVVELHSSGEPKRPTPLPADTKLEKGKIYLMIPMRRGQPNKMSYEEARRILLTANSVLRTGSFLSTSSRFLPLFKVQRKEYWKGKTEGRFKPEMLPELLDERPEYLSHQFSGKGWKPSLDTIKEKNVNRKKLAIGCSKIFGFN